MRALHRLLPGLETRVPWTPLAVAPTRVQRVPGLEALAARGRGVAALWVKRDDLTSLRYGGNKVRKLELLLAAAAAAGARRLVTTGGLGSNHALATALFGADLGIETTALLVAQPMTPGVRDSVRNNLRALAATGAEMILCGSWAEVVVRGLALGAARAGLWPPRPPRLVWPGGSSPVGVLGYVDAALELAEQVRAGELPAPDVHVVAAGTGGTAAGLLAGLHLAGIGGEVVAVRVVERPFAVASAIRWLAAAALRRLARAARARLPALSPAPPPGALIGVAVLDGYMGDCYGAETAAAMTAIDTARAYGLAFDPIYTGKALAAVLGDDRFAGRRVLLWHTKSTADLAPLLARCPDPSALPTAFHRFFDLPR